MNKEIIKSVIYNYEEIEKRKDFLEILNVENEEDLKTKLKGIIGQYKFKNFVKCGISSCRQKHKDGFLAELNDGKEIIIGNKCGTKFFGIGFNQYTKSLAIQIEETERYNRLKEKFNQLESMIKRYENTLNNHLLNYNEIRKYIKILNGENGFLNYKFISTMKQSIGLNGVIYQDVFKTSEEMKLEREMLTGGDEHKNVHVNPIKKEIIGHIENYDLIWKLNDFDKLIKYFEEIHTKLKHPEDMKKEDRKTISKKLAKYENNLYELNSFCKKANILLRKDNILQMKKIFFKQESDQSHIVEQISNKLPI